jgi:hypothetical protein
VSIAGVVMILYCIGALVLLVMLVLAIGDYIQSHAPIDPHDGDK